MKPYGPLQNYLIMYRRKTGLSQREVAALLGLESRASLGRYEQGLRTPDLEIVLALELVLGQPASELFAGVAETVKDGLVVRAQALLESIGDQPSHDNLLKLALLTRLARIDDEDFIPWEDAA